MTPRLARNCYDLYAVPFGVGHATTLPDEPTDGQPNVLAAVLWLPDPEARRGWANHAIVRLSTPPPDKRAPLGFHR